MAQFYTLEEAARVLGMGPDELKSKAQQREVRAFMDGGSWRFRVVDIDELARRRGLGSDPDLSMSDLDLDLAAVTPEEGGPGSDSDFDLSEFAMDAEGGPTLGAGSRDSDPELGAMAEADLLMDDVSLPPGPLSNTSSTIIGLEPARSPRGPGRPDPEHGSGESDVRLAMPSGSDVRPASFLHPLSDSDVTVSPGGPADSDVRLSQDTGSFATHAELADPSASHIFTTSGATRKAPRPKVPGSSDEVRPARGTTPGTPKPPAAGEGRDSGSDFELASPGGSRAPAGDFESGSDFELDALDSSDEFETTPAPPKKPGDSDVTAFDPAKSGINLGRPSDSGINLQAPGFAGMGRSGLGLGSGIGLAPDDDHDISSELSATALPVQKPVFEDDTDFEVEVSPSDLDDRTVQLDAASDFDLNEADDEGHTSEVFAIGEEDVDTSAATALGPALPEESSGEVPAARAADSSIESPAPGAASASDWDIAPTTPAPAGRGAAPAPVLASAEARQEWGGVWVGFLMVATVVMLLMAFVTADLLHNLYGYRGETPVGTGLVKQLAALVGK